MAAGNEVGPVREDEFETLLPLIAAYQRFYEADDIDGERSTWLEDELQA